MMDKVDCDAREAIQGRLAHLYIPKILCFLRSRSTASSVSISFAPTAAISSYTVLVESIIS